MADTTATASPGAIVTPQVVAPTITPVAAIKGKIAIAQPDIAAAAAQGHSEPLLTKILSLLIDIAPDILDLFASPAVAAVGTAVVGAVKSAEGDL